MAPEPANPLANGVTAELYKAAIGPCGQDYYLRHFLQFDAQGRTGASWHWPACWSTLNWLVFRRMWGWALAYGGALLGLILLIFGLGKLLFNYSDASGLLLFLLFLSAASVLPGLYANAWYYTYCSEKISEALRNTAELKDACAVLATQASTKRRWLGLAAVNVAVLALLASVAVFVLNFGQAGAHRVQPATAAASVAGDEPVPRALPASQPASPAAPEAAVPVSFSAPARVEELVANVADKAIEKAPIKVELPAMPDVPSRPEPIALAVAPTDPPTSTPQPARAGSETKPQAVSAKRQWFVQVGAFAKEANAHNVRAKLEAVGLASAAEPSDTPAGRLRRVRVGPFDAKGEAERAALQVKALDLPAVLVRQ